MTGSELYQLLNYMALLFGFSLYVWMARFERSIEVVVVLCLLLVALVLFFVSDTYPVVNSLLLFLCLRHIYANRKTMERIFIGCSERRLLIWVALSGVIGLTYVFSGIRGWQSVMVTSMRYWVILITFFAWRSTGSAGEKAILTTVLLALGMVWGSKIVIVCGAVLFLFQLIRVSSFKDRLKLGALVFLALLLIWIAFNEQVQAFLVESVLRPDYDRDVKILGLSDGSRITLWSDYLEGARLIGKGDYLGADLAPTHNIFVYFVYEFGFLPAALSGLFLILIAFECLKASGIEFLLIISFCFLLSSVFEYGTAWVFPLIVFPFFTTKRFRFRARR